MPLRALMPLGGSKEAVRDKQMMYGKQTFTQRRKIIY